MLDKIDKKANPFKVPENYFENFNNKIMEQLPHKEVKKSKIVPLWKKVVPWTAAAAILCGVIFSTGVLEKGTTPGSAPMADSKSASYDEEDYFLFLEDEVMSSQFKDMMYN